MNIISDLRNLRPFRDGESLVEVFGHPLGKAIPDEERQVSIFLILRVLGERFNQSPCGFFGHALNDRS